MVVKTAEQLVELKDDASGQTLGIASEQKLGMLWVD